MRQRRAVMPADEEARIAFDRDCWRADRVRSDACPGFGTGPSEAEEANRWTVRRTVIASDQAKVSARSSVSCDSASWSDSWSCPDSDGSDGPVTGKAAEVSAMPGRAIAIFSGPTT